jgi:hypothetical protein
VERRRGDQDLEDGAVRVSAQPLVEWWRQWPVGADAVAPRAGNPGDRETGTHESSVRQAQNVAGALTIGLVREISDRESMSVHP